MKVYTSVLGIYCRFSEPQNLDELVGIFPDPESAYISGQKKLTQDYDYDPVANTWRGDFVDDVWVNVYEYELGGNPKTDGALMCRDSNGNWYNSNVTRISNDTFKLQSKEG